MPIKKKIKKSQVKNDPTYGQEPDLLDQPGIIVEPDVRKKIADYFKKMMLRETIRSILYEIEATGVQSQDAEYKINMYDERKKAMSNIAIVVSKALNLIDVRFLARSKRLYGAYTYAVVDNNYRNVILKIQSIDEMEGYKNIQKIRNESSEVIKNHLPIIFSVNTLRSLGIHIPDESLCAIVMERLEELPGNLYDLISSSPGRSKISLNALLNDRDAFTSLIDKIMSKLNQSIINIIKSSPLQVDANIQTSVLRRTLISISRSLDALADDNKDKLNITSSLLQLVNDKIDLWCSGLNVTDSALQSILKIDFSNFLKFELSSRAVPREPMSQNPGTLGVIKGIKPLIAAIEELKHKNIVPQDLHGNNIMIRPDTGELVISDLGHFN